MEKEPCTKVFGVLMSSQEVMQLYIYIYIYIQSFKSSMIDVIAAKV